MEKNKVARLIIHAGRGVLLCPRHWAREMLWRKGRNKNLLIENQFKIEEFLDSKAFIEKAEEYCAEAGWRPPR